MNFLLAEAGSSNEDKAKEELRQEYKACFSQGCNSPRLLWRLCNTDCSAVLPPSCCCSQDSHGVPAAAGKKVDRELSSASLVCAQT